MGKPENYVPTEGANPAHRYALSAGEAMREFARALFKDEPSDLEYLPERREL